MAVEGIKEEAVAQTHRIDQVALVAAEAFYTKFKLACIGSSYRDDLERLYYATFHTFANMNFDSASKNCPSFKRVMKELERTMGVVRYNTQHLCGPKLEWTEKPSFDPNPEMDRHDPSRDVVREYRINRHRIGVQTTLFKYNGQYCGTWYGDRADNQTRL